MRDLKSLYKKQNREVMHKVLLDSSREWRGEIFAALAASDVTLIVACIESYSGSREKIKSNKEQLTRHSFSNGLMRFGLHAQQEKPDFAQVVLDWPDGGNSQPFDAEYSAAFNLGKTKCGAIKYQCGPLNTLNFVDSSARSSRRQLSFVHRHRKNRRHQTA